MERAIQVNYDKNDGEQINSIKLMYATLLHDAACEALTVVLKPGQRKPKNMRYSYNKFGTCTTDILFARMWFNENPNYVNDIKAERKITFKDVCYVLDLPYNLLKPLICPLINNINNIDYINKYNNIYNNIYLYNKYIIYNNIPFGDK